MDLKNLADWATDLLMVVALAIVCALCGWLFGWGDLYKVTDGPNAHIFYGCATLLVGAVSIYAWMQMAWDNIKAGRTEVGNPAFFTTSILMGGGIIIAAALLLMECPPRSFWWRMGLGSSAVGIMIMAGSASWRIHMLSWQPTPPAAPTTDCHCCH